MKKIPGPTHALTALPLALRLLSDPRRLIAERAARWGRVWQMRIPSERGFRPLVWLLGPAANERVLAPEHKFDFSWREGYERTSKPMFGEDVLLLLDDTPEQRHADGTVEPACPAHRDRHRELSAAFAPRLDRQYLATMYELTERRLARWPDEGEIDIAAELKQLSFHIAAHLLLGARDEDLPQLLRWFEAIGLGLFSILRLNLPGTHFRGGLQARRDLGAWLGEVVCRYREEGPPPNLLGHLMREGGDSGSPLSDEVLIAEMISHVFAGYDTVASLLGSVFHALSGRSELYPGLRDEARALGEPTPAALASLRTMEAVMKETQRLHPPLPFGMRGVRRGFDFEGFHIAAGDHVAVSSWYTQRMPELFEAPDEFRPERFLEGGEGRRRYSQYELLPFGAGWRPCIGKRFATLEAGLVLNQVLQRFDLGLIPGQSDDAWWNPAMHRRHGTRVRVRRVKDRPLARRATAI